MGKPQHKVKIKWSPEFAYAIGLLTTDGNLSSSKRHITFVSKDKIQVENFQRCLRIKNKIGHSYSGAGNHAYRVQFGDVSFYKFLLGIGLTPKKSLTLGKLAIPSMYFMDFLRGHFDGDGTFYSYWDKRWRSSYMFYTELLSASKRHILWLQGTIFQLLKISGHITKSRNDSCYQLKYAKADSLKLLPAFYYAKNTICLLRKRLKIRNALRIIGRQDLI